MATKKRTSFKYTSHLHTKIIIGLLTGALLFFVIAFAYAYHTSLQLNQRYEANRTFVDLIAASYNEPYAEPSKDIVSVPELRLSMPIDVSLLHTSRYIESSIGEAVTFTSSQAYSEAANTIHSTGDIIPCANMVVAVLDDRQMPLSSGFKQVAIRQVGADRTVRIYQTSDEGCLAKYSEQFINPMVAQLKKAVRY